MPRCESCDAEIKFIRTAKSRNMPVDIKPITVITSLSKTIKAWPLRVAGRPDTERHANLSQTSRMPWGNQIHPWPMGHTISRRLPSGSSKKNRLILLTCVVFVSFTPFCSSALRALRMLSTHSAK